MLEVDEHQHRDRAEDCECARMVNISQSFGIPTIFIRYNPDPFRTDDKKHDPTFSTRTKILKLCLDAALNITPDNLQLRGFCSMTRIFFNGWKEGGNYQATLLEFEN